VNPSASLTSVLQKYEPVIGLEVHCQLLTATKIFCGCANRFGAEPNTLICPVCLGLPGALPVLSRRAVTLALRAALATHCTVQPTSIFARKNYFYPDLPKGYQISQYELPLALDGYVEIGVESGERRRIRLHRIHMEEDAGKLIHEGFAWTRDRSGVDLNRAGVPLIEIVSQPEMHSAQEAHEYLSALKAVLLYAEVSDCNMEEGSLRCDANVSIRLRGVQTLGTRAEIKNLNSFRNVARAIEYEIARQAALLDGGGAVVQETRLWNADRAETVSMRSKEEAHDYRYFTEPDLPPLVVSAAWIEEVRRTLPEPPAQRRERFVNEYHLSEYDADVLIAAPRVEPTTMPSFFTADLFEDAAKQTGKPKAAANLINNQFQQLLNDPLYGPTRLSLAPNAIPELVELVESGTISANIAAEVLARVWSNGGSPRLVVDREGLAQTSDEGPIRAAIAEVIATSASQVATYKQGKTSTLGWFVGQVMKKTGGKANPQMVNALLKRALDS
jgi:aspartyl-tRNA(Asn)/glutamyl-tRNA(Gln) amidotransferase subunit B